MNQDVSFVADGNKDKGLTPRELFQKHLKDPEHHVTDEELRSLKVGAATENEIDIEKATDTKKEDIKSARTSDSLPNPYNVLK